MFVDNFGGERGSLWEMLLHTKECLRVLRQVANERIYNYEARRLRFFQEMDNANELTDLLGVILRRIGSTQISSQFVKSCYKLYF